MLVTPPLRDLNAGEPGLPAWLGLPPCPARGHLLPKGRGALLLLSFSTKLQLVPKSYQRGFSEKNKRRNQTINAGRKRPAWFSASAVTGGNSAHRGPRAGLCRVCLQLEKMPVRKATSELTRRKPPRMQEKTQLWEQSRQGSFERSATFTGPVSDDGRPMWRTPYGVIARSYDYVLHNHRGHIVHIIISSHSV